MTLHCHTLPSGSDTLFRVGFIGHRGHLCPGLERNLEHFLFCACARKHTGAEALLAFLKAYIPFGKYAPKAVNRTRGVVAFVTFVHHGRTVT
jgi:hypothetical protein